MDILIVVGLISLGLGLMIVELIFIPGTTIVGILGFGIYVYGVYSSFGAFGTTIGWIVLVSTMVISIAFVVYSLKMNAWDKFALKDVNKSRVNEDSPVALEIGKEGISISSIKPIGKGEFENREYEIRSMGNFIEENKPIKVIKIDNNRIFVEQLNT
ncbi:MAG: hypothetical protein O2887_16625 [Bacteroidetes bacterium]|nr:hypothetical protein [Bacteroidota bacterium]MDA1122087.1 hypothetical protein [Bacteroidota bacterium]